MLSLHPKMARSLWITGEENVSPGSCLVANDLPSERSNTWKVPSVHATNIYLSSHQGVAKIGECNSNIYLNFSSFCPIICRGVSRQYRFLLWLAKMTHSLFASSRVSVTGYENTLPYITCRHICNDKESVQNVYRAIGKWKIYTYQAIRFDIETTQYSSYRTK